MQAFRFLRPFIVTNFEYPACKDCTHFAPAKHMQSEKDSISYGKCTLFREKDLVTGKVECEYASSCRIAKCKKEAVYFEHL